MQLSKSCSIGLAVLTAFAVATPNVEAHNPAKYTDIPFVVAAACSPGGSKIVSSNGAAIVQSVIGTGFESGFEVYCSVPSTATLPGGATGLFPQGTLSFNLAGLPTTGDINALVVFGVLVPVSTPSGTVYKIVHVTTQGVVSNNNGIVTVGATRPSASTAGVVVIQVFLGTSNGNATVTMSSFRYDNSSLMFDTTVTDQSATGINYCANDP